MNQEKAGRFCWNELATSNVSVAKDFYGKMFGWTFEEHTTDEHTYTMIKSGDSEFGGMWQIPTEQKNDIPPHWMGYILVDNLEKTLEEATHFGATIKVPLTKAGEHGCFAVLIDPTGAHIAVWESFKSCQF